ncbi:SDR family NAD(P)-dependent oxidoreductase, partial [Halomonas sp. BBD48]|nr:SDR family NAD(P)-dependent oxidoreductase [Halomonas sp. BBD48]
MFEEFRGKRILITGASRGIGAAVARRLGACGAHVGVHYYSSESPAREVAEAIRDAGGQAFLVQGDVSQSAKAAEVVGEAAAAMGGLDVLINNAGDMLGRVNLDAMDDDQYDKV